MPLDKPFKILPFISLYAFAHLIVDAASAYLLLGVLDLNNNVILAMLIYNTIAFVFQAPLGLLVDKMLNPKHAAIIGLILVALSFLFWNNIYFALIIVSFGNALFHVGGGSLVLSLKDKKATFAGIFVAPGAIGLALGSYISISQVTFHTLTFPFLLLSLSGLIYIVKSPSFSRSIDKFINHNSKYSVLIIILILIPIVVRSLIGLSIHFPWKQNQHLLYILIIAIALGKVFGGVLADKFGLIKVGVGGLLVSAPLLAFYSTIPLLGIVGSLIFNFTMPVTLIAILTVLPKNKGLTFGLSTAAVFIGSLPSILQQNSWLQNNFIIFTLIAVSLVVFLIALNHINKIKSQEI